MRIVLADAGRATTVEHALRGLGMWTRRHSAHGHGGDHVAFAVTPTSTPVPATAVRGVDGVVAVYDADSLHPLVDAMPRTCTLRGRVLGVGEAPALFAGPCSVESEEQIHRVAAAVARHGAVALRGGAWKPRTSPRGFQGHGTPALGWLVDAARAHGLAVVTEVVAERDVDAVAAVVDVLQVGARTMHSGALLRAVGAAHRPVLLKRAFAATLEEWLLAGEALLLHGAPVVLFCERGVRGPDNGMRNVLDVGAVAVLAHAHGLPVVVDPSHAAGRRDVVVPLAMAGLAAGACGVVIEVHDRPAEALSDAPQALDPEALAPLGLRRQ
ncbi:MAG: 3-deoxy-7-phosphoheptulonate synthase [Deltaproteobacteria bacterium]|nr:3-deoxy-7-phosphoheptulonate synthase [Deltaproteobacteria bacterium]